MQIIVYDIEVFAYDWIVIFFDTVSRQYYVYHNDNQSVRDFMSAPNRIFCGFNNKHYDNHVVKAICCGADPALVKQINDFIIVDERNGWDHWFLRKHKFWFDSFDLMDDCQVGTSLKSIEAHLGLPIVESEVDFNIDRPLTPEELESTIKYCKYDVAYTTKLLTLRKGYLDAKLNVGRRKGMKDAKALYMTNARLTAAFLDAVPTARYDEREYVYPDNLDKSLIPSEVLRFFDQVQDLSIPSSELFNQKLKFLVDGAEAIVGFGGIHHAQPNYHEVATGTRVIRNFDVASLYPSLMVKNGYTSRNIPSAETFEEVYHTRLNAKASGDKHTANTLKLILNTTYGASLATTNPLYDPLMGRSVCITGQLYILELAMRYLKECQSVRIIQLNTDGIMISIEDSEMATVYRINEEWQESKQLILEEDRIKAIYQKDVNNYVMVFENDKVKTKGAYVTFGIPGAGAFSINNNFVIVKRAVIDYFVSGTPVEDTVNQADNILDFQIIAKAGGGYKSVYKVPKDFEDRKQTWRKANRYRNYDDTWKYPVMKWSDYDGPRQEIQKVNRVYASILPGQGSIVKIKADGTVGKIQNMPDSCIIDNRNELTLDQVDRSWYIDLARKYVEDYIGAS